MKPLSARLLPVLAALMLFGAGQARAELVNYDYSWSVSPSAVLPGGTGSVTLALAPDGANSAALGALS